MGDGGALFTRDEHLAKRIKMIANHGQTVQYQHDDIGVNSRLDTLQAAILNIKLTTLDACEQGRLALANAYDKAFGGHANFNIPTRNPQSTHVFHQYTLRCNGIDRNALREFLSSKNVPSMVYYPIPLHVQKAYQSSRYPKGSLPVTEKLCKQVISLPMSPEVTEEQKQYIITQVLQFSNNSSQF